MHKSWDWLCELLGGVSLAFPLKYEVTSSRLPWLARRAYHQLPKIATMTRSRPIAPPWPCRPPSAWIVSGDYCPYQYGSIAVSNGGYIFTETTTSYVRSRGRAIRRKGDNGRAPWSCWTWTVSNTSGDRPATITGRYLSRTAAVFNGGGYN